MDFLLDPETARYAIDQLLIRLDLVAWFASLLAAAIILRVAANPVGYLVDRISLALERVIRAWRRGPAG